MAYNIVTKYKLIPAWNDNEKSDQPIEIEYKKINTEDYWKIISLLNIMGFVREKMVKKVSFIDDVNKSGIVSEFKNILSTNIISIKNLQIDGKDIKPAQMADYHTFVNLNFEIITDMAKNSGLSSNDKKKSNSQ